MLGKYFDFAIMCECKGEEGPTWNAAAEEEGGPIVVEGDAVGWWRLVINC